jgi:prepilin-type N-terminal cleavage/methylation domain-containing protein
MKLTNKYKSKREQGFTIIEVLIVLAIAGLIILIVFLAVPALQRNSRNTQRRNDVSAILGAIQEYANNNGGDLPIADSDVEGKFKAGYYNDNAKIFLSANPPSFTSAVIAPGSEDIDSISNSSLSIITGYKCTAGEGSDPTQDAVRSVAIVYVVEEASGNGALQCQDS